jgi:hypothetical protein
MGRQENIVLRQRNTTIRRGLPLMMHGSGVTMVRRLSLGLSHELWLVQIGIFLSMFGYGAVLPFEVIYLHDGRGFSLSVAGLVVGMITGVAIVTAPLAGPLIDRFGRAPPRQAPALRSPSGMPAWRSRTRPRLPSRPPPSRAPGTAH